MSSPESPSPTRPLRVAGMALLGLAVIALVIGLISVFGGTGEGDDNAQPPSTRTSPSEPGSSEQRPPTSSGTSTSEPTSSSPTGGPTTTTTRPGDSPPAPPPGGDGNGEPGKTQPVRIYNNSTVEGLASQAAEDLRAVGWNVVQVDNYPYGTIPTTTVYYRPGTAERQAAEDIAGDFGMRVEERFTGIDGFAAGVIVIVTNDYDGLGGENDGK